jgi:hypothetical protein
MGMAPTRVQTALLSMHLLPDRAGGVSRMRTKTVKRALIIRTFQG